MNVRKSEAILGILLCAALIALWNSYRPLPGMPASHMKPLTPAMQAQAFRIGRLDAAAIQAMEAGQYAEAEAKARQSVALGIASGLGQELLAAALDAQGKTREAMAAYQAISDVGGVFPRYELPYALLLLKTGHWAKAVAEYDKAVPPRPGHGLQSTHDDFANSGLMRTHNHFSPAAPRPREMEADILALGVAEIWWGGRRADYAQQRQAELRRALALAPDSEVVRYYYAYGLWDVGQRGEAREGFRQVAQESYDDIRVAAQEWLRPELVMTGRDSQGRLHQMVVMDTTPGPRIHPLPAVPTLAAALRAAKASGTNTASR